MGLLSGLFGSSKSKVTVPGYVKDASVEALDLANALARIGYVPNYGAEVAAFTPMQEAAMANTNDMARAFGMQAARDPMAGMPQARNFGGIRGYSTASVMDDAIERLKRQRPDQYEQIRSIFTSLSRPAAPAAAALPVPGAPSDGGSDRDYVGGSMGGAPAPAGGGLGFPSALTGGYTSFRDMIDGGGPGVSGGPFQGAGMYSTLGNIVTGR